MSERSIHPRNPWRQACARLPELPAWTLGFWLAVWGLAVAAVLLTLDRPRMVPIGGIVLVIGLALLPRLSRLVYRTPVDAYASAVVDSVGDAIVLVPLAWPLRYASLDIRIAVIAAVSCVFIGAYAQVKAGSLRFEVPAGFFGAPERLIVLGLALVLDSSTVLAWCLWLIATVTLLSALSTASSVWKQAR